MSDSGIFEFPSGHVVQRFPLGKSRLRASTHGDTFIVAPLENSKAGIVDLQTRKILLELEFSSAVDVYDQTFVIERRSGDIALYDLTTHKIKAEAALPRSLLGALHAWAVSRDLGWLAVSGETRGAVWDLSHLRRLYFVRGFQGGHFDDNNFYGDFPKLEKQERAITRLDLRQTSIVPSTPIAEQINAQEYGPYLLVRIPQNKNTGIDRDTVIEIHDVRDHRILWARRFQKETPRISFSADRDRIVLAWRASDAEAESEIRGVPALKSRFDALKDRKSVYFLEVLDAATGTIRGRLFADTGKRLFAARFMTAAQDWVLVGDADNRIHIYSLSSGDEKGVVFGSAACISATASVLAVEIESGQLDLYSLPTLEKRVPLIFRSPISAAAFSGDGRQLFVLTANQTAYKLDPVVAAQPASTNQSLAP